MAEGVTTNDHRKRMAAAMAGGEPLYPIAYVAYGDGGHTDDLQAKAPSADASGLGNELLRKPFSALSQVDDYSVSISGRVESPELIDKFVSEFGAFDAAGNLVGLRTFRPKIKESDESYLTTIKLRY